MRQVPIRPSGEPPPSGALRFSLLALGLLLAGLAGFAGFLIFPRLELPSSTGAGLLLLAAAAGIASFFSPCSFPLLLTLLARQAGDPVGRIRRLLAFAGAFSVGAALFLAALAGLVALGAGRVAGSISFTSPTGVALRIAVGILLVVLGLIQAGAVPISFHGVEHLLRPVTSAHARLRRRRPATGALVFGFGYLLAGFG